jgi:hypothetical protein
LFTRFLSSLELVFSLFPLWKQTQVRFAALSFCRNQGFSLACYYSPVLLGWRRQGAGFRCTLVIWSFVLSRPQYRQQRSSDEPRYVLEWPTLPLSDLLLVPPHHREGAIVAGTTMSNNI